MKVITIAILAATLLLASACVVRVNKNYKESGRLVADGNIQTETHALSPFKGIHSSIPADVVFIQSEEEPHLVLKASKNILPFFKFEVVDDELRLKFKSDSISTFRAGEIKVTVYGKSLDSVAIAGSGDFDTESLVCEGDFSLSLAGSGDADIENISCENCNLAIAGSGDIELGGTINGKVSASIAGSGDITLSGKAAEADFSIAGSGDIDIRGMEIPGSINSRIKGSGEVYQK